MCFLEGPGGVRDVPGVGCLFCHRRCSGHSTQREGHSGGLHSEEPGNARMGSNGLCRSVHRDGMELLLIFLLGDFSISCFLDLLSKFIP